MKVYKFFLYFLIITSCAHYTDIEQSSTIIKIQHSELQLPMWLVDFPHSPYYCVGISYKEYNNVRMIESAQQFAAVQLSRNLNSIAIKKYSGNYSEHAKFELNVSSSLDNLKYYDELVLIDSIMINDYFIGLFQTKSSKIINIDSMTISNQTASKPDWYKKNEIITANNNIISIYNSSSADLITALSIAFAQSRLQIVSYLEKNIETVLLSNDQQISKFISIESNKILGEITVDSIYISSQIKDSLQIYKVYVKIHCKGNN